MPRLRGGDVGRRRVELLDVQTGERFGVGVVKALGYGNSDGSLSDVKVALDGEPDEGPLGDGASYAHDVQPLEEELAKAEAHPEYGIDTAAVRAALAEAKADAATGQGRR